MYQNLIKPFNHGNKMKPLFEKLGEILKPHAVLTSMGLPSERALEIVNNRNLTFIPKYMSLTEGHRARLKAIAESIYFDINFTLNSLKTEQIKQVVKDHTHIAWTDPKGGDMFLDGITKEMDGRWYFAFDERPMFVLHDLEIQECLNLLATCENITTPTTNVILNS